MPIFGEGEAFYKMKVEKRKRAEKKYAHITGHNKRMTLIYRYMRR